MAIMKIIAKNKKAAFSYFLEDSFEAGIVLTGSEVKSLRQGKVSVEDTHADYTGGHLMLLNCHIQEYDKANQFNHFTRRPRILLLHRNEIKKIVGKIKIKGYTLVLTSIYFNEKNKVKVALAIGKGKKLHDKRETIKERDWERSQGREMRSRTKE